MTQVTVRSKVYTRPYEVKSIDQLPSDLLNLIKNQSWTDKAIEGIFVIPAQSVVSSHMGRQTPLQCLIFTGAGVLHVAASPLSDEPGRGQWILAENILSIKLSLILLYGKLEIWFLDSDQISKLEVEYNAVGHPILSPMLHGLIRKTWKPNRIKFSDTMIHKSIDGLYYISFGFYNGLRLEALHAEEKMLDYVYQPEIKIPRFGLFHRSIAPQAVIAITDQQIILLQQDLKFKSHHEEWIFTFIPLYRISHIDNSEYESWRKVKIIFSGPQPDQSVEAIFEPGNALQMETINQRILR